MKMEEAIKRANETMSTWSEEDLRCFAFDRLVNEYYYKRKTRNKKPQPERTGRLKNYLKFLWKGIGGK